MKEHTTDRQKAVEQVAYVKGCWWVEECLVRDDQGLILGKIVGKTLVSPARMGPELAYTKMGIVDDRPDSGLDH